MYSYILLEKYCMLNNLTERYLFMKISDKTYGSLLIHLAVFFWGFSFIPQKILLQSGFSSLYIVFFRFSFILLCVFFIKDVTFNTIKRGFFLGLVLFSAILTQVYSLKYLDVSVSAFLLSTNMVLIPIFNYILFKKKITIFNILAMFSAGIGVIFFNQSTHSIEFSWNIGILLALLSSLCFTLHIIFTNHFVDKESSPFQLHIFQSLFALVAVSIFVFFLDDFPQVWNLATISSIIFVGFVGTVVAYGMLAYGQKLTQDPLKTGLIMSLHPVWTFIFAIILLNESLTTNKLLGIFFIAFGVFLCEWESLKKYYLLKK